MKPWWQLPQLHWHLQPAQTRALAALELTHHPYKLQIVKWTNQTKSTHLEHGYQHQDHYHLNQRHNKRKSHTTNMGWSILKFGTNIWDILDYANSKPRPNALKEWTTWAICTRSLGVEHAIWQRWQKLLKSRKKIKQQYQVNASTWTLVLSVDQMTSKNLSITNAQRNIRQQNVTTDHWWLATTITQAIY